MDTWMNLENIILRERKQRHKGHVLYDPMFVNYPEQVSRERESRLVMPGAGRGGMGSDA